MKSTKFVEEFVGGRGHFYISIFFWRNFRTRLRGGSPGLPEPSAHQQLVHLLFVALHQLFLLDQMSEIFNSSMFAFLFLKMPTFLSSSSTPRPHLRHLPAENHKITHSLKFFRYKVQVFPPRFSSFPELS